MRRLPRKWHMRDGGDSREGQIAELPTPRSFAGAIAAAFCEKLPPCPSPDGDEVFISYGSTVSVQPDYYVRELFECDNPEAHRCTKWSVKTAELLANRIVLLGGTFQASRDFHDTPAGSRTPGLIVNAHAVQAEIHGPAVRELGRVVTIALDVLVGLTIGFLFSHNAHAVVTRWLRRVPSLRAKIHGDQVLWRTVASFGLAIGAAIASVLLLFVGILWLSWIGMVLVGVSWHIVTETPHMRMLH